MKRKDRVKKIGVMGLAGVMTFSMISQIPASAAVRELYAIGNIISNDGIRVQKTDYEALRNQWFQELIGITNETKDNKFIRENIKNADADAKVLYESMKSIGNDTVALWDDIIANNKFGAIMTAQFERLLKLAKAYQTEGSIYYKNEDLKNKLIDGIKFVNDKYYSCTKEYIHSQGSGKNNWWDWEIGTPTHVANLLIVLYNELPTEIKEALISNIDTFTPNITNRTLFWPTVKETGANRADKALILTLRGIAGESADKLAHVRDNLPEIFNYVTKGDGFYKDGSFIQHGNVAYTGAYGYVLLDSAVNILSLLQKTEQAIPNEKYANLYAFVRNSFIPALSLGGNNMDLARGRSVSRESWQSNRTGKQILSALIQLAEVAPESEKAFIEGVCKTLIQEGIKGQDDYYKYITNADINRINSLLNNDSIATINRPEGFYALNNMERAIAHRNNFTFGLSMSSNRISNYETGNNENLKGWYTGQGMTYFYTNDIQQYNKDFWPTVDQLRLPGVTSDGQTRKDNATQSPYATSNTIDGVNGTSTMILSPESLTAEGNKTGLSANKSWFVLGDAVVALGSGINSENNLDVETIIDNHRTEGNKALIAGGNNISLENDKAVESSEKWFHLQGNTEGADMGYVILNDDNVTLKKETRTAPWSTINQLPEFMTEDDKTNTFISLAINHDTTENDSYAYAVYPGKSAEETRELSTKSDIKVLANTEIVHAVYSESLKTTMYNFFEAGSFNGITVDGPASVIIKEDGENKLYSISSLDRSGNKITLTLDGINGNQVSVDNENVEVAETAPLSLSVKPGKDGSAVVFTIKNEPASEVLGKNLSIGKVATASSTETNDDRFTADKAIDGKSDSRWSAGKENDEENLTIDLGEVMDFNKIKIYWGDSFGAEYKILVSDDGVDFKEIYSTTEGAGGVDTINLENVKGRFVRYQQLSRWNHPTNGKKYGTSIYEFEIYNSANRQNVKDAIKEADVFFETYTEADVITSYYKAVEEAYSVAESVLQNPDFTQADADNAANNLRNAIKEATENLVIKVDQLIPSFTEVQLKPNESEKVEISYSPENATYKEVDFTSSDNNVATVDEEGVILAKNPGEAIITVTSKVHDISTTINVKVKEDKSKLQEIIDEALKVNQNDYTEESYAKLDEAILNAKGILDKDYATKVEIDKAISDIEDAIKNLEKVNINNGNNSNGNGNNGNNSNGNGNNGNNSNGNGNNEGNDNNENNSNGVVNTGDSSSISTLLALLFGSAGVGTVLRKKSKNN